MKAKSLIDLKTGIINLLQSYNAQQHLNQMENLTKHSLTEQQFSQLIGKTKLYNYLSKSTKREISELMLNDEQISTVAGDYY